MKKLFLTLSAVLLALTAAATVPHRSVIPDIPGYKTLKGDFHMHTNFSDASVWPVTRVDEADFDGLDFISITDHLETHHQHMVKDFSANADRNTSYQIALKAAKKYGTLISFDLNYRATFWKGREAELSEIFSEIAGSADILVGNEEDFQLCLGIQGPEAGGKDLSAKIDSFKEMINRVKARYSNASVFATTLRQVVNANTHLWGAIMLADDQWQVVEPREIRVLDRIGGGDGFVGGLLYAVIKGWESEKWVQFGWASGALATTFLTDYAQPADEDMVWSVWSGNARVKR